MKREPDMPAVLSSLKGRTPQYLDHGFWIVTAAQAKELGGGRLPKQGYAIDRTLGGTRISVQRTPHGKGQVWACMVSTW